MLKEITYTFEDEEKAYEVKTNEGDVEITVYDSDTDEESSVAIDISDLGSVIEALLEIQSMLVGERIDISSVYNQALHDIECALPHLSGENQEAINNLRK